MKRPHDSMTSSTQALSPASGALSRAAAAIQRALAAYGNVLTPLVITAVAGFLRFWRLGEPHSIVPLDETYYAPNSFGFLCHGFDMSFPDKAPHTCAGLTPTFAVHPPVGKLLTAVGIKIFGYRPFGWRFAAALAGTLSVLLIYLIARRLWTTRWPAVVAAILLAADGLFFVQSRLAMLDIFLALFILLGLWLLLEDRARAPNSTGIRWWRIGSGVAFGLAVGSKWGAIPMLPVVAAVALAWEAIRIRDARDRRLAEEGATGAPEEPPEPPEVPHVQTPPGPVRRRADTLPFQILAVGLTFLVLPAAVYLATYTTWFASTKKYVPPRCNATVVVNGESKSVPYSGLRLWWCNQREIFDYHKHLESLDAQGKPIHPYMSKAWSWPWISRPASHYFETFCAPGRTPVPANGACPNGPVQDQEVLGLPNPVIWWTAFFLALPMCVFWALFRRDEVAALLVVLFAPLVIPWLVYSRPLFMFYMTPAVPFLVLFVVHMLQRWRARWTAAGFVVIAVAMFAYFYPVLAAYPLPASGVFGWDSHIWFGHGFRGDCTSDRIKLLCWI